MTASSARQEIAQLRRDLDRHNRLYYIENRSEISDREFDALMARLSELEAEHPELDRPDSPTHRVGGEPIAGFRTIEHQQPMLSIENVYEINGVRDFDHRLRENLDEPPTYSLEYKIDGVALAVIYEQGMLTQAVTRGDGRRGDDVTHNARTIRGLPLALANDEKPPRRIEIRGEAYIANSDFARLRAEQIERGDEPYANPRNLTAGSLKMLDPKLCAPRRLRFFAHGLGPSDGLTASGHAAFLEQATSWGIPVTPRVRRAKTIDEVFTQIEEMTASLHELDVEVDGIVLKVDRFEQREELGATSKFPRWAIAYKWERYEATSVVESISVQVGRTGKVTPVAHVRPVEIAGTTVSRASLHNRDEIERLDIQVGDTAVIEKAGKIIPHVVRVETSVRTGDERPFLFPTYCPECETPLAREADEVDFRCPNTNCPARLRESLRFFASRSAMDIDTLGIKRIEQLLEANLLHSLADIYRLKDHREELLKLERSGERSVEKLVEAIDKSRDRPLWRLLAGLNIRHVGGSVARVLETEFGTLDALAGAGAERLAETEEIGPVIAETVTNFFTTPANQTLVEEFRELGLNFGTPVPQKTAGGDALAGKSIVVTGTLPHLSRQEAQALIRRHGGKATSSVSKNTALLVAGERAGSKLDKARELGVEVIDEAELLKRVGETVADDGQG